jgi:hypothetical protein
MKSITKQINILVQDYPEYVPNMTQPNAVVNKSVTAKVFTLIQPHDYTCDPWLDSARVFL